METIHQRSSKPDEYGVNVPCLESAEKPECPYVGFWNRTAAALIDSVLLLLVTLPIQQVLSGGELAMSGLQPTGIRDLLVSYVLPAAAVLVFWKYRSATPGKMFMAAEIVDAATGGKPASRQLLIRYLGYYVSTLPLLLGLVWVAFDPRKQGWHDKLAGTVVVSTAPHRRTGPIRSHVGPDLPAVRAPAPVPACPGCSGSSPSASTPAACASLDPVLG